MISFCIGIVALVLGYFIYGKFIEKIFGIDANRTTPAYTKQDGVDYIPMKPWRIFLIQFLNIAGVGPICGAIMGAKFGTASYLWIVLGSIFAGAVHDYLSGMMSIRHDGCSLPELHGKYMGKYVKQFMRAFMIILMILVGVVFVNTPATLLNTHFTPNWNIYIWVGIILAYYLIATLLPIDKIIGKIYPIFGFLLFGMALAIVAAFVYYKPAIPELWDGLSNPAYTNTNPIFPMMFISIACGAISGFHATQSPLMARCMTNEKQGRPIFYGAMISEGIVALIWAAAASYFFGPESPVQTEGLGGPAMVGLIANTWFTPVICVITILGVISASVTSGDTALRSARLIVADFLHVDQKKIINRLYIAIPLFIVTGALLIFSLTNKDGFETIWRYFGWANQLLAVFTLWSITIFLALEKRETSPYGFILTLVPALFMTMVCSTFILIVKGFGFGLPQPWAYGIASVITLGCLIGFIIWLRKTSPKQLKESNN
jgi:carbon starvation protein CstA